MSKDIRLLVAYCNNCGKSFELTDLIVERCIYCGSECIIKVKLFDEDF